MDHELLPTIRALPVTLREDLLESGIKTLNDDIGRLRFCMVQTSHAWSNVFVELIGLGKIGVPVSILAALALWLLPGILWILTA